jgi:hypothetical protein
MSVALSKTEYKRRLDAALALRGMKRAQLPDLLVERGLKRNAASRAGHASDDYAPNEALAIALGKILGVGQDWFEEPDLGRLVAGAESGAVNVDELGRRAKADIETPGSDRASEGGSR